MEKTLSSVSLLHLMLRFFGCYESLCGVCECLDDGEQVEIEVEVKLLAWRPTTLVLDIRLGLNRFVLLCSHQNLGALQDPALTLDHQVAAVTRGTFAI